MIALALLATAQAPNFAMQGRFQKTETGYVCEWPGSAIVFGAKGPTVSAKIHASTGNDRWQVEVDGKPTNIVYLNAGERTYSILIGEGHHRVRLVKRSEAFCGPTEIRSITGASALKLTGRWIEVIGDSISAGFGVDGKKETEKYSFDTANAYMTYGQIAARKLSANCTTVAWSGKKMWPDNSIPDIYDYVLPSVKKYPADFSRKPQAVIINLATNDFGGGIPDRMGWSDAYRAFIKRVQKNYPSALIYLATGSMMSDNWPPNAKHLTTLKSYLDGIVTDLGDKKIKRIDFAPQEMSDGIGSAWHPNVVTQTKMAGVLEAALRRDLGW